MTVSSVLEQQSYLAAEQRNAAYATALASVLGGRGGIVLDLGCGAGLLGILAVRAGATRVHAVDSTAMIEVARQIARTNGVAPRIVHHRDWSTELDLPELADVVVCDQVDGVFGLEAGLLDAFVDARDRLARPGASLLPAAVTPHVELVGSDEIREVLSHLESAPCDLDVGVLAELARNDVWYPDRSRCVSRSDVVGAEPVDLASYDGRSVDVAVEIEARVSGPVDAIACPWRAELGPSSFSNLPEAPGAVARHVACLPVTLDVQRGEMVRVSVRVHTGAGIIRWTAETPRARSGGDTFSGLLLGEPELRAADAAARLRRSSRGELMHLILGSLDGSRTAGELGAWLDGERADLVARRGGGSAMVRRVVEGGYAR